MDAKLFTGDILENSEGSIGFCNDIDLSRVVRIYELCLKKTGLIKAWQVHHKECKWVRCIRGQIMVKVVKINTKKVETYYLDSNKFEWLYIPYGHANGIRAINVDATLLIGSNLDIINAELDNGRWPQEEIDTNWF